MTTYMCKTANWMVYDNDNENTLFDHNIQIEITIYKQFK